MYKKTAESSHFIPRRGKYSMYPHRNDRVDILPAGAKMALYDIASQVSDAEERIDALRAERNDIQEQISFYRRVDSLRGEVGSRGSERSRIDALLKKSEIVDSAIRQLRRHSNEMRTFIAGRKQLSYPDVFLRLAEAELPHDVYGALSSKAAAIVRLAKS